MIIKKRLIRFGNSKVITLPKQLIGGFGLAEDIVFDIKIVPQKYQCFVCKSIGYSSEKCLVCGASGVIMVQKKQETQVPLENTYPKKKRRYRPNLA